MKKRILSMLLALCLIAGLLPFAALAAGEAPYIAVVLYNGSDYLWNNNMVAGAATRYATTSAEGVITEATETADWNVKLEYPAGGTPTLTLKGATIKAPRGEFPLRIGGTADIAIVIESDSTISTVNRFGMFLASFGVTTITGQGKLTVASEDGSCICTGGLNSVENGETLIKDANIEIKVNGAGSSGRAIQLYGKDMTIDNSKVNIIGTGLAMGIFGHAELTKDANGKVVSVSPTITTSESDVERNVTIQNGSVITGNSTSGAFLSTSGKVTIKDSTVEAEAKSQTDAVFSRKPVLEGEYTAVGGSSKEKVTEYKAGKANTYKYVKVVPGKVDLEQLGVTTKPSTAPTTAPTTDPAKPTTAPTGSNNTPTNAPTGSNNATSANNATSSNKATSANNSNSTNKTNTANTNKTGTSATEEGGLSGAVIAVIIVAAVLVLAAGTFAVLWFVVKPKWLINLLKK